MGCSPGPELSGGRSGWEVRDVLLAESGSVGSVYSSCRGWLRGHSTRHSVMSHTASSFPPRLCTPCLCRGPCSLFNSCLILCTSVFRACISMQLPRHAHRPSAASARSQVCTGAPKAAMQDTGVCPLLMRKRCAQAHDSCAPRALPGAVPPPLGAANTQTAQMAEYCTRARSSNGRATGGQAQHATRHFRARHPGPRRYAT